ncbi:hypothetical protein RRG08_063488, partial [Elysia crispata]
NDDLDCDVTLDIPPIPFAPTIVQRYHDKGREKCAGTLEIKCLATRPGQTSEMRNYRRFTIIVMKNFKVIVKAALKTRRFVRQGDLAWTRETRPGQWLLC